MRRVLYLLIVASLFISLLPAPVAALQSPKAAPQLTAQSEPPPSGKPLPPILPDSGVHLDHELGPLPEPDMPLSEADGRSVGAVEANTPTGPTVSELFDRGEGQSLLTPDAYPYSSHVYTHSDLLIFGYQNGTALQVVNGSGSLVWSGTLGQGQHKSLTPGAGIFKVAGSAPFSLCVGDELTNYVWGYYALDQYGKGASSVLYTYQANWGDTRFDPHFIVFAYHNGTSVMVRNTNTGAVVWQGVLNAGQHYDNTTINNMFITVTADKPVSALSYTDQGYFVPADTGVFTGKTFYTFAGNSGGWTEYLNIMAYENTSVTVTDSNTGGHIWSGTLAEGGVQSLSGLNGRFVTVRSSGNIAVSVHPAPANASGYYHSLYAMDATGSGIGSYFILPTISGGQLVWFAYDDNSQVTITNAAGSVVHSGVLNAGQWNHLTSTSTVYRIRSTGRISVIFDWGDEAGADFAPVHYGALRVEMLTPRGESYLHGDTLRVQARVMQLDAPLLGATVEGSIDARGVGDALRFMLRDDGLNGDAAARDAIYTAETPLPDAAGITDGAHQIYVTARNVEPDGTTSSGSGVTNFVVSGVMSSGPGLTISIAGPQAGSIYINDSVAISAIVTYGNGGEHADTAVTARISRPDGVQMSLPLNYAGAGIWRTTYYASLSGPYLIDVEARPPSWMAAATSYAATRMDVLQRSALVLTPDPLGGAYPKPASVPIGVQVTANNRYIEGASVFALVNPGGEVVPMVRNSPGHYYGEYVATMGGAYNVNIYASVPFFLSNQTSTSFVVTNASAAFATHIRSFATGAQGDLAYIRETAAKVADDGDFFKGEIGGDIASTIFDLASGIDIGFHEAPKVIKDFKLNGIIRGYTPGLDSLGRMENVGGVDGRTYRSWATRTSHALRESLLDPTWANSIFPPYVGPATFTRASRYYLAAFGKMTVDELAEKIAEYGFGWAEGLIIDLFVNTSLRDGLFNLVSADATEYGDNIHDYGEATLAAMPGYGATAEESYMVDLSRRRQAGIQLGYMNYLRNSILFDARSNREGNNSLVLSLIKVLLHQALRVLVGVLADGPGVLLVDGAWTGWSLYEDIQNLAEDLQMWNFAAQSLIRSGEEASATYTNAVGGLARIKWNAPPQTATGEIVAIQEYSTSAFCWKLSCEQEVYARTTIRNNSPYAARYKLHACYYGIKNGGLSYFANCVENVRLDDGTRTQWVDLGAYQSATVDVVFKDKKGEDVRPPNGTVISYVLFAENNTGVFQADTDSRALQPQGLLAPGLFSADRPELIGPTDSAAALAATSDTIPHPIALGTRGRGEGVSQRLHIEVVNPFAFSMSATIVQPLPSGVGVADPGGAFAETGKLTWRIVVPPHDMAGLDYALSVPGLPSETVSVPAAQLILYIAQEASSATFYSASEMVNRRPPMQASAALPPQPGRMLRVPVEVTNYGASANQTRFELHVRNTAGQIVGTDSLWVGACAGCTQTDELAIDAFIPTGTYGVEVLAGVEEQQLVAADLIFWNPGYRILLPLTVRTEPPAQGDVIRNGGFETGRPPTPWTEYSNGGYQLISKGVGYGESWGAYLAGFNNAYEYIEQSFTVPANAGPATLSLYWGLISDESTNRVYDSMSVTLRNAGGQSLTTLMERNNTHTRDQWFRTTVPLNLSAYRGQTLRLRIESRTDYSAPSGFYVDNVSLMLGANAPSNGAAETTGAALPPPPLKQ